MRFWFWFWFWKTVEYDLVKNLSGWLKAWCQFKNLYEQICIHDVFHWCSRIFLYNFQMKNFQTMFQSLHQIIILCHLRIGTCLFNIKQSNYFSCFVNTQLHISKNHMKAWNSNNNVQQSIALYNWGLEKDGVMSLIVENISHYSDCDGFS